MKTIDLAWIAGILEGEGHFRLGTTSPNISLQMSDLDIIEKFRNLTKTNNVKITVIPRDGQKTMYNTNIYGNLAIQWMMTIYSLMGIRRKTKIKDIIEKWKTENFLQERSKIHNEKYKDKYDLYKTPEYKLIKTIMKNKNCTKEEAEKLVNSMKTVQ